jgi:phage FluMu protein Com
MNTALSHGYCHRCKQLNLWTKLTCDFCGERLAWAELNLALQESGKCPRCQRENLYSATACGGCGYRLPWADTMDMVRKLAEDALEEARLTSITISVCVIVTLLVMVLMLLNSIRPS